MLAFEPDTLPIAMIGRPHGIAGEIRLRLFDPESRTLDDLPLPFPLSLELPSERRRCTVSSLRRTAQTCLVVFAGLPDRESVARLTGAVVRIDRSLLPPLAPGEYYIEDLAGCTAFDPTGRTIGTVRQIYWNGAQHILSIACPPGSDGRAVEEVLVPVAPAHVTAVDAGARRLTIARIDP